MGGAARGEGFRLVDPAGAEAVLRAVLGRGIGLCVDGAEIRFAGQGQAYRPEQFVAPLVGAAHVGHEADFGPLLHGDVGQGGDSHRRAAGDFVVAVGGPELGGVFIDRHAHAVPGIVPGGQGGGGGGDGHGPRLGDDKGAHRVFLHVGLEQIAVIPLDARLGLVIGGAAQIGAVGLLGHGGEIAGEVAAHRHGFPFVQPQGVLPVRVARGGGGVGLTLRRPAALFIGQGQRDRPDDGVAPLGAAHPADVHHKTELVASLDGDVRQGGNGHRRVGDHRVIALGGPYPLAVLVNRQPRPVEVGGVPAVQPGGGFGDAYRPGPRGGEGQHRVFLDGGRHGVGGLVLAFVDADGGLVAGLADVVAVRVLGHGYVLAAGQALRGLDFLRLIQPHGAQPRFVAVPGRGIGLGDGAGRGPRPGDGLYGGRAASGDERRQRAGQQAFSWDFHIAPPHNGVK